LRRSHTACTDFLAGRDDAGIPEGHRRRNASRNSRGDGGSADDHFQVISEHRAEELIYDPGYLGVKRSEKVVFVQITLSVGRKPGQKRGLFKRMAELLEKSPGLRKEDLLINLVETTWEKVVWKWRSAVPKRLREELRAVGDMPPSLRIR
jgi:tautomerase-like protein